MNMNKPANKNHQLIITKTFSRPTNQRLTNSTVDY